MINIEQILSELYILDPDLKKFDSELRVLVLKMAESRPDIKPDLEFAKRLRRELMAQSAETQKGFSWANLFTNKVAYAVTGSLVVLLVAVPVVLSFLMSGGNNSGGSISNIIKNTINEITKNGDKPADTNTINRDTKTALAIRAFASEDEFKKYLSESQDSFGVQTFGVGTMEAVPMMATDGLSAPTATKEIGGMGSVGRVSDTNVQVAGIDEPDIVKTDGKEIYFSSQNNYYARPMMIEDRAIGIMPPIYDSAKTKVIKAFPLEKLGLDAEIDASGDLLLSGNTLVVFSGDKIYGYNISNPSKPEKKWTTTFKGNSYLQTARLYKGSLYIVTKSSINRGRPCPVIPLTVGDKPYEIACTNIYHPTYPVPSDVTFNAMLVDPSDGAVKKSVSFVGSSQSSVIYMSGNALYATYSFNKNVFEFSGDFINEKGKDLFPGWLVERINKLNSMDISSEAKSTEFGILMQQYESSLDNDERLKLENEMQNRMSDYVKAHVRELETTGLVKISLDGLEVKATGRVPGSPLNQFSLDEYENNLRIAVTIGGNWWGMMGGARGESVSDVYVLNSDLKELGSVRDLGKTERIYAARFIEDKGYIVTFRQTDPFYVLDLKNPSRPELKGELKIPGYSSYLDPISKDRIIGVGKEGGNVKVSLFGVSDPARPVELDKYTLDDYWSEIESTHHAFLLDKKHGVFFMPGGKGGYVFSYAGDKLKLERAVSNISAKRAIYLDDFMYIIGDNKIVVLDETTWKNVKEFEL
jgi:uncharacterized secreted protein with C-terminal beta-propeller domain